MRYNIFKSFVAATSCLALSACGPALWGPQDEASSAQTFVPSGEDWRSVDPENLLILRLKSGSVAIELAEEFAPAHTAQIRNAARAKTFDKEFFYRVIEGHVAQAGLEFDAALTDWPKLKLEAEWPAKDGFVPFGNADLFADDIGHSGGFAAGRSDDGQEWLLHCEGSVAMARDTEPDTGSIEFYIPIGPRRYLDRNLTVFGRVIDGYEHIVNLPRVDPADEKTTKILFGDDATASKKQWRIRARALRDNEIVSAKIAADIPKRRRPDYQIMRSAGPAFDALKTAKRVRSHPFFFHTPPEVLDICAFELENRLVTVQMK